LVIRLLTSFFTPSLILFTPCCQRSQTYVNVHREVCSPKKLENNYTVINSRLVRNTLLQQD
jgi:hypothetical protein